MKAKAKIFFSYARQDERLRNELEKHLSLLRRQGLIAGCHDHEISAGMECSLDINTQNTASIILLLVSSDFLASDHCYIEEVKRAMKRHKAGKARVIPVILRPVDWKGAPFGMLDVLPNNAKPVTKWRNRDEAFFKVAEGIRKAVEEL